MTGIDFQLLSYNFTDNIKSKADDTNSALSALSLGKWHLLLDSKAVESACRQILDGSRDTNTDRNTQLRAAVGFLYAFVQSNFTGPKLGQNCDDLLKQPDLNNLKSINALSVDGEELNSNVNYPEYLHIAKILVANLIEADPENWELRWWRIRLTTVHQQVMDELCHTLYTNFKTDADWFRDKLAELFDSELRALLMIEVSEGFLLFHRTQKSQEWLDSVCKFLDTDIKVEGLLGIRTKYQQKPLPQLCLKVKSSTIDEFPSSQVTNGSVKLPKLSKLDDDVRLETIQFMNPEDNEIVTNPSIVQCLILAKLKYIMRSQPKDKLSDEEIEPFITSLLQQEHGPLAVRLSSLLLKASQEINASRTVERSLKICEEVSAIIESDSFRVQDRLSYYFAAIFPSKWSVGKQLGDSMVSLGLVKSALDVYLQIKSWEDVILCYNHLELRHKAAEIIQQELDKQPTATLYCLLGDATDDVSCYEKAWNFSNETSSRAQRHWGNYYYFKKDYETAIPHFQRSLEINALQEVTLLRLGYAAITLEKWELAAQSYLRYTHLEPNGFESWNNLAKALIKLGDKNRAHKILNEALKCNFNNWKVWENFLLVSVDTGHFEDVINAYSRLVELKDKYKDFEVLEILVKAVIEDIPDSQGRTSGRLKKKLNNLLGQQCVHYASDTKIWELAASLADSKLSKAEKLQKAYRAYVQSSRSWIDEVGTRRRILELCHEICTTSLEAFNDELTNMEKSAAVSQLSSARLSTQATVRAVENAGPTVIIDWDECETIVKKLKSLLENVTNKLKQSL